MIEIFVFGSFWFSALIIAEIILLFVFVEYENGFGATVSLIVFASALQWLGDVNIIGFVSNNPFRLIAVAIAYFLLGSVWGSVKWWLFVKDRLEKYEELRDEFLTKKGLPTGTSVPANFRKEWKKSLKENYRYDNNSKYIYDYSLSETPRVLDNKSRIMRWMSFWPISMLWSFLDDFVKRIFKTIYQKISNFLQRISDNIFSRSTISEDLDVTEEE